MKVDQADGRKLPLLLRLARAVGMAAVFVLIIEGLRSAAGDRVAYHVGVFILMTMFWYALYR